MAFSLQSCNDSREGVEAGGFKKGWGVGFLVLWLVFSEAVQRSGLASVGRLAKWLSWQWRNLIGLWWMWQAEGSLSVQFWGFFLQRGFLFTNVFYWLFTRRICGIDGQCSIWCVSLEASCNGRSIIVVWWFQSVCSSAEPSCSPLFFSTTDFAAKPPPKHQGIRNLFRQKLYSLVQMAVHAELLNLQLTNINFPTQKREGTKATEMKTSPLLSCCLLLS